MVQFELKLIENVVEKWRDYYLDYQKLKKILKDEAKTKSALKGKSKDKKDKKDKKGSKHGGKEGSKDDAGNDGRRAISESVATVNTADASPSANEKSVLLGQPSRPQSAPPDSTTTAANTSAVDEEEGSMTKSKSWLNLFSVSSISPEGADVTLDPVVQRALQELSPGDRPRSVFEIALFEEVHKFCSFYQSKRKALRDEFDRYAYDMSRFAGLPKYSSFGQPGTSSSQRHSDAKGGSYQHIGSHAQDSAVSSGTMSASGDVGGTRRRFFGAGEVKGDGDNHDASTSHHMASEAAQDPDSLGPEEYAAMRRSRFSRRRALSTLYKEMLELKNFAGLNYTAVIKIVKKGKKCLGEVVEDPEDLEDATMPEAPAIITVAEAAEAEAAAEDNPFFTVNDDDDEESAMPLPPVPSPAAAPAAEAAETDTVVAGAGTTTTSAVAAEPAVTPPPRVSRVAQAALSYADRSRDLSDLSLKWMAHYHFDQGNQVQRLINELQTLYAALFCDGELELAMGELEAASHSGEGAITFEMLKLGFRLGLAAALALWFMWDCMLQGLNPVSGELSIDSMPAFPAFCAMAGLLSVHWSWGLQVLVWTRFRINYVYIFELDPRFTRSYTQIFSDCASDSIVFFSLVLLYFKAVLKRLPVELKDYGVSEGIFVLAGLFAAWHRLLFPWVQRRGLWQALFAVACPWRVNPGVCFFHTYVGDVLTSMVKCFLNLQFTVFFVASGGVWRSANAHHGHSNFVQPAWLQSWPYDHVAAPSVVFLPLWFRFVQCLMRFKSTGDRWPHLYNALKYGLMMTVTVFGALHPLYTTLRDTLWFQLFWITLFVVSTLYSAYWDICLDWGLGKLKYQLLNDRQMYPKKWYYYSAMVGDLVLRFVWIYTLIPPTAASGIIALGPGQTPSQSLFSKLANWLAPIAMLLEMVRRTFWGLFRLENEQLHNTEGYRRVNFVPLHFDHTPERLNTTGRSVAYEVLGFGLVIVASGALVIVLSGRRYDSMATDTDES